MHSILLFVCASMALCHTSYAFLGSAASGLRYRVQLSMKHFDYLVIGAGSGGMASARRAAQYGAKVGVIEDKGIDGLGGTCVNVGCVPKKVMWNAAAVNEVIHEAHQFGFEVDTKNMKFDWGKMKNMRDAYITRLNGIYGRLLGNSDVELINGYGSFKSATEVAVTGQTETYTADNILIAVGGRPNMPNIPGIEHAIDSNKFFELTEQPARVAIVGGGYIGVELAGVFHALGSDATLFLRGEKPLRGFDDLIVDTLIKEMGKQKLSLQTGLSPTEIVKNSDGTMTMKTDKGDFGPFDSILFATGRVPLVDKLGLENTQITLNKKNMINVDEFQTTEQPNVYAVGDVSSDIQLTPTAIAGGRRLADRLFNKKPLSRADYEFVPTVVFSHPCIGTIGYTEADAKAKYGDDKIRVYTSTFTNLWYGPWQMEPDDKPKVAMKLVCLGEDEKVIGVHSIGMGSDELLQGFAVAVKMGATKADFDSGVAIHPTAAEEMVTMGAWGRAPSEKYGWKKGEPYA